MQYKYHSQYMHAIVLAIMASHDEVKLAYVKVVLNYRLLAMYSKFYLCFVHSL